MSGRTGARRRVIDSLSEDEDLNPLGSCKARKSDKNGSIYVLFPKDLATANGIEPGDEINLYWHQETSSLVARSASIDDVDEFLDDE